MDSGVDITGLVLTGRDADDFLVAQPDAAGSDDPASPDAPRVASFQMFHPYGFAGLPLDADKKGRCQALQVTIGDQDYIIALDDPRATSKLPPIKKGESFMYSAAGNFFRCHMDGKVSLCTSDKPGSPDGKGIAFILAPTEIQQFAPWGDVRFGGNGWHMRHESGARIDAGAIYGVPGLPSLVADKLTSYVSLKASRVSLNALMVLLGQDGVGMVREPLAKATSTYAVLVEIVTALNALVTYVEALSAIAPTPGVAPGIALAATVLPPLNTAMTAINATIGPANLLMASNTSST